MGLEIVLMCAIFHCSLAYKEIAYKEIHCVAIVWCILGMKSHIISFQPMSQTRLWITATQGVGKELKIPKL